MTPRVSRGVLAEVSAKGFKSSCFDVYDSKQILTMQAL